MAFRPCIDLRNGKVVQVVGGTFADGEDAVKTNFVSERSAAEYAELYKNDALAGGHVIMLGPGNEDAARSALSAYPGGMQVGGGLNPANACGYLDSGASHVIVTSYLFDGPKLSRDRLRQMSSTVGSERLVVDLSCRSHEGRYHVATDRWKTITETVLGPALFEELSPYCDEFLIHAADVEGLMRGIDRVLVEQLGRWVTRPTTYAGGATSIGDIRMVEELSGGKLDLTIGSALDIFGGGVRYSDAAALGRR